MQRHEVSKQDVIHVHERISRLWGSQRNLSAGSEPIRAQALYEFICSWVCFTIAEISSRERSSGDVRCSLSLLPGDGVLLKGFGIIEQAPRHTSTARLSALTERRVT